MLGTTEGGVDILAATADSLDSAVSAIGAGTGSSTVTAISTSLDGNATLGSLVVNSTFTATERSIYAQISASTDTDVFDDNVGEFGVAVKYVQF